MSACPPCDSCHETALWTARLRPPVDSSIFEVDGQSLYDTIRRRGFDVIGAIWLEPSVDESRLLCSAGYRPICRLIASRCSCAPSAPASVAER